MKTCILKWTVTAVFLIGLLWGARAIIQEDQVAMTGAPGGANAVFYGH
jgi:hypothetical protein